MADSLPPALERFLPTIQAEGETLPGGVRVLTLERGHLPIFSLHLMLTWGAADGPGQAGLADLMAEMLRLGTAARDSRAIAQDLEELGAELDVLTDADSIRLKFSGLAPNLEPTLAIAADLLRRATLPGEEFTQLQDRRVAELRSYRDDPGWLARQALSRLLYRDHPYAYSPLGTESLVAGYTREDVAALARRACRPSGMVVACIGAVPAATARARLREAFGDWTTDPAPPEPVPAPPAFEGVESLVIDKADLNQSQIRVGHPGVARRHPDLPLLRLANYALGGGGFASRLMARIRSEMGLTYGIHSQFDARKQPGPFLVGTFTPLAHTGEVITEIRAITRRFVEEGITEEELAAAREQALGRVPFLFETHRRTADALLDLELYGLPPDYFRQTLSRIAGASREAVNALLPEHFLLDRLAIAVAGRSEAIRKDLEGFGPVTVRPVDDPDL